MEDCFALFMVTSIDQITRCFYRVPNVVVHKGGKCKKLIEKLEKWLAKPTSVICGREVPNGKMPMCNISDHFIKGELIQLKWLFV